MIGKSPDKYFLHLPWCFLMVCISFCCSVFVTCWFSPRPSSQFISQGPMGGGGEVWLDQWERRDWSADALLEAGSLLLWEPSMLHALHLLKIITRMIIMIFIVQCPSQILNLQLSYLGWVAQAIQMTEIDSKNTLRSLLRQPQEAPSAL